MDIKSKAHMMKLSSNRMAASSVDMRHKALSNIKDSLGKNKEEILSENQKDLNKAREDGISEAVYKRLKFDEKKLATVKSGIDELMALPDPLGRVSYEHELEDGLLLKRVSCPIGVLGVIFEARPDALVQIASLCIKSGNCAILKGGKETTNTNRILFSLIYDAAVAAGLPESALFLAETHSEIDELLSCEGDVDLIIPRGSNAFVRYIMEHTRIPVMGHADGVCHTYVDVDADINKAIPIVVDAKIQYTAACNATETLLIHRDVAEEFLPQLAEALSENGVRLRGTGEAAKILNGRIAESDVMGEDEFNTENLDLVISVKLVSDVDEAIEHINRFGSHHTDAIITENDETAEHFMNMVDSAGVYQNASTRFADGFRYGFGAEVGISTSKIHARGPVGLEGLLTYKYKMYGHGDKIHIVKDFKG